MRAGEGRRCPEEGNREISDSSFRVGRELCTPSSGPADLSRGPQGHAWPQEDSWTKRHSRPAQPTRGTELNCNLDDEGASAFLSLMHSNKLPSAVETPAAHPPTRPRAACPRGLRQHMSVTIRPPPVSPHHPAHERDRRRAEGAGIPCPCRFVAFLFWPGGREAHPGFSVSPVSCLLTTFSPPPPPSFLPGLFSVIFPPLLFSLQFFPLIFPGRLPREGREPGGTGTQSSVSTRGRGRDSALRRHPLSPAPI